MYSDSASYLHETVISTLVAGISPVIGSNSHTEAMSSSLSITSPSMGARDKRKLSTSNSFAVLGPAVLTKISQLQRGLQQGDRESASVLGRAGDRARMRCDALKLNQQCYKKKKKKRRQHKGFGLLNEKLKEEYQCATLLTAVRSLCPHCVEWKVKEQNSTPRAFFHIFARRSITPLIHRYDSLLPELFLTAGNF